MTIRQWLLALALGTALSGQTAPHPLPAGLQAAFGACGGTWADRFRLPVQESHGFVTCTLRFRNSEDCNRVELSWAFGVEGSTFGMAEQVVGTSFRPTAVARRAGTTSRFYVVGWSDRTGRVIVEEWTIGPFELGVSTPEAGGSPRSVFSQPPITQVLLWVSDVGRLSPVRDAACHTPGDRLLLLTHGEPTTIWSLHLEGRTLVPLYSAIDHPILAGHRMMSCARHPVGGYAVLTERRSQWTGFGTGASTDTYVLARDVDGDGEFDVVEYVPDDELSLRYPPPWDNMYPE